jgi:hypothetical protein
MKKLKTFWHSFQKSLLDFAYYKDIAKVSFWFSFKYLLFLLICLSLIRSVQLGVVYSLARKNIPSYLSIAKKELAAFYPKELELRISNGKLYTNVQEPYTIEFPKVFGDVEGKHLIVIDTKASPTAYKTYNTIVLATREVLIYPDRQRANTTTTQMYFFSDLKKSIYIDQTEYLKLVASLNPYIEKLPKFIDMAVVIGLLLLPLVGGFFWTSGTLFGLLFLTLIIWIVGKLMKSSYGYKTLFRMGIHGSTWSILFTFLLDITNQRLAFLYNLIFIVWMIIVLVKNKEEKTLA